MTTPSVTKVLSPYADFSHVPPDRLAAAAQRGTAVHEQCRRYAENPAATAYIAPGTYLSSFIRWHKIMVASLVLAERELFHEKYQFHGHPDFVFILRDGASALIDIKTPITKSRLWCAQLAAYSELCRSNKINVDKRGVLQLDPKGKMAKITWYSEDFRDFNAFLAALTAWRYFR